MRSRVVAPRSWREFRRAQRRRRAARMPHRTADILLLERNGFRVRQITPTHFRIDGALDLFPLHRTFHDLQSGLRGSYNDALSIAVEWLFGLGGRNSP